MDLDFNACLTLLIIAFVFAIVTIRLLLAVVNRGFLLVDYAKAELYPGGKQGSGKMGPLNLLTELYQMFKPAIQEKVQTFMGVKPK